MKRMRAKQDVLRSTLGHHTPIGGVVIAAHDGMPGLQDQCLDLPGTEHVAEPAALKRSTKSSNGHLWKM